MSGAPQWFILGFTSDDVIVCWQDSRLAGECVRAWQAAGRPAHFQILQAPGEGKHLLVWFLNQAAVGLLDAHRVEWRQFLIGECVAPPPGARNALSEDDKGDTGTGRAKNA